MSNKKLCPETIAGEIAESMGRVANNLAVQSALDTLVDLDAGSGMVSVFNRAEIAGAKARVIVAVLTAYLDKSSQPADHVKYG